MYFNTLRVEEFHLIEFGENVINTSPLFRINKKQKNLNITVGNRLEKH